MSFKLDYRVCAVISVAILHIISLPLANCQTHDSNILIFYNANIWTVDEENPTAEAVAIKDGKFIAVASNEEVLKLKHANTRKRDLRGNFVVPGFNDNHVHFASAARFLEFNIMKAANQEEFVEKVRDVVQKLPDGDWILGGLWGAYDSWAEGSAGRPSREVFTPEMSLVEDLTRAHPMFIRKFDNSDFAVNAAALKALGLSPFSPSELPEVNFIFKNGRFNGILKGKGVLPYVGPKILNSFSHERRLEQTRRAVAEIRKYGVTNVSDISEDEQLDSYRKLRSLMRLSGFSY